MQKKLRKIKQYSPRWNDNHDVPPGQFVTDKFPVLTFGKIPNIDKENLKIQVFGLIENEISLNWHDLMNLPQVKIKTGFHCVTQWSRLINVWQGVQFKSVKDLVALHDDVKYIMIHCYGGYTTNLPLDVMIDDDVILAYKHDKQELSSEHGGPLRLVVPKRYSWKSAKWVNGIEFMSDNRAGFWESRGYHMDGDPWKEQRFKES